MKIDALTRKVVDYCEEENKCRKESMFYRAGQLNPSIQVAH
jgi:hypothetical protein